MVDPRPPNDVVKTGWTYDYCECRRGPIRFKREVLASGKIRDNCLACKKVSVHSREALDLRATTRYRAYRATGDPLGRTFYKEF